MHIRTRMRISTHIPAHTHRRACALAHTIYTSCACAHWKRSAFMDKYLLATALAYADHTHTHSCWLTNACEHSSTSPSSHTAASHTFCVCRAGAVGRCAAWRQHTRTENRPVFCGVLLWSIEWCVWISPRKEKQLSPHRMNEVPEVWFCSDDYIEWKILKRRKRKERKYWSWNEMQARKITFGRINFLSGVC